MQHQRASFGLLGGLCPLTTVAKQVTIDGLTPRELLPVGSATPGRKMLPEGSDLFLRLRYSGLVKQRLFHDRHDHVNAWPGV